MSKIPARTYDHWPKQIAKRVWVACFGKGEKRALRRTARQKRKLEMKREELD